MHKNIPNILTLARLLVLPFLIATFFFDALWSVWLCLALYVFGAVTDFFDGWYARKFDAASAFGKFLDPIADKVFVSSILLMLVAAGTVSGLWVICVVIILMREFLVAGLREYLAPLGKKLPVTRLAKWKTTFQMVAIALLIAAPALSPPALLFGLGLLGTATLLTIVTGYIYLSSGLRDIMQ